MFIPNNILKHHLKNVFWILGKSCSGKTTAALLLSDKYQIYHYHGDNRRAQHFQNADTQHQPALSRNVPDMLALSVDEIRQWEHDLVAEMTPMILIDLIQLCGKYDKVIFEGDILLSSVLSIACQDHIAYLSVDNELIKRDFFNRPDHQHMINDIEMMDIDRTEKVIRINKFYELISDDRQPLLPDEIVKNGIKHYIRNDSSSVPEMVQLLENHFHFV